MANIPDISLPAEVIYSTETALGTFEVTNSVLATGIVSLIIIVISVMWRFRISMVPSRFQVAGEMLVEYLDGVLQQQFVRKKLARVMLPYMVTLFIFIFIANQFSIIPIFQSIIIEGNAQDINLFRAPTSDLSLPFVMALVVLLVGQIISFTISPLRHIGNFIKIVPLLKSRSVMDFFTNLIEFFLGFLDIISELAKTVALACRLFGNVLAGELMVLIIAGLSAYTTFIIPIPFYVLSIFSGVIQTLVFVFLAIGFMSTSINAVEPETA